ncbi:MAG: aspartate aminotransferase family protein [Verrucomicrobiae bacterium]|nr:aspartate aminotransferase family protein [Verrucomicrobiae bacterium]
MADWLPRLRTAVPGPRSRQLARRLARCESPNVTHYSAHWPIFWRRARGVNVWDVDGNRYLDLTAAFGVSALGHAHPRVMAAAARQMNQLVHGMGDVHPHERRLELAEELIALTYRRWGLPARVVLASSGAEAVEIAIKTAVLATGRPRILAFHGAYHGLTYGALDATHRRYFRWPFAAQLGHFVDHVPFGKPPGKLPHPLRRYGAVLVEPIQGRAGIRVPPAEFLPAWRTFCDRHGLVLIADEIFTGFGRTGRWFACEHSGVVPDVLCVGKALAGGFPLAACVGRDEVMRAWPKNPGEAIHTSTFMGHPVGCAAGVAALREMQRLNLPVRAAALGALAQRCLPDLEGKGLMLGLTVRGADRLCQQLLQRGILVLPEGDQNNRLAITPPLTISARQLEWALRQIAAVL